MTDKHPSPMNRPQHTKPKLAYKQSRAQTPESEILFSLTLGNSGLNDPPLALARHGFVEWIATFPESLTIAATYNNGFNASHW